MDISRIVDIELGETGYEHKAMVPYFLEDGRSFVSIFDSGKWKVTLKGNDRSKLNVYTDDPDGLISAIKALRDVRSHVKTER